MVEESTPREPAEAVSDTGAHAASLRKLASELVMAEVRERRRIAEDLHDHMGQYLALIRVKLAAFQGNTVFCGYEQDLLDIQALLDKAISYTRHLTMVVSPPMLYELGLLPALTWLSEQYSRRHQLAIRCHAASDIPNLETDLRGMLYRSIRELLLNVVKHANARTVDLEVRSEGTDLIITLTDDGVGFDPTSLDLESHQGFGLFSIRERLTYLGGILQLWSEPGSGTRVTLRCPVQGEERS